MQMDTKNCYYNRIKENCSITRKIDKDFYDSGEKIIILKEARRAEMIYKVSY